MTSRDASISRPFGFRGLPLVLLALSVAGFLEGSSPGQESRPNIIYILADDLGYGDLGCQGQKTLKTPNLDRMAAEGMRFTRHYAGSTVCAPSRCVLLTGLHSGHGRVRGNGPALLRPSDVTFAEHLQKAGYVTGAFGKWGVGSPPPLDDPNKHGFDEFFGYVNMLHAHNYFPEFLVRDGRRVTLRNKLYPEWKAKFPGDQEGAGVSEVAVDYAPQLIGDAALDFIKRNHARPFFAYYAFNIPHANNEGASEPRIGNNGMRVPDLGAFAGKDWPVQEKGFARMIQTVDDDVARILALLKELKIDDRTIVMFSSDNGPHQEGGHKVDFFDSNGPLRGFKRDLYEGGVRVPFLVRWPGKAPAGQVSSHVSGFLDMYATMLELAGIKDVPPTDGVSLVPSIMGRPGDQKSHAHLYWEFQERGGSRAVLKGNWKAVRLGVDRDPNGPIELYDLGQDPAETQNVAASHPEIVEQMSQIMAQEHVDPN